MTIMMMYHAFFVCLSFGFFANGLIRSSFHNSYRLVELNKLSTLYMSGGGFGAPKKTSNNNSNSKTTSSSSNESKKSASSSTTIEKELSKQQAPSFRFPDATAPYQNHVPSLNTMYPGLRQIHNDPPIYEIDNFFTPDMCKDYIDRSMSIGFEIPSQTFATTTNTKRTSTTWFLKYQDAPEFIHQANKLLNIPIEHFEEPQLVQYQFGQQFTWHYDYIPQTLLDDSGNRLATIIVYLNDVSSGGNTCFKDLNLQVRPQIGKALLFFPCYRDGKLDDRMTHAGQVALDTKWIAQM